MVSRINEDEAYVDVLKPDVMTKRRLDDKNKRKSDLVRQLTKIMFYSCSLVVVSYCILYVFYSQNTFTINTLWHRQRTQSMCSEGQTGVKHLREVTSAQKHIKTILSLLFCECRRLVDAWTGESCSSKRRSLQRYWYHHHTRSVSYVTLLDYLHHRRQLRNINYYYHHHHHHHILVY